MDLQQAVRKNWTQEAESYNQNIQEELGTERRKVWEELILRHARKNQYWIFWMWAQGLVFFQLF